jgi:hypothetical protein
LKVYLLFGAELKSLLLPVNRFDPIGHKFGIFIRNVR